MRVLIVGGGVGGNAAAAALTTAGATVTVLESRDEVNPEEGSIVTLAPNGVDALVALGGEELRAAVARHAVPTDGHDLLDARGRTLGRVSVGVPLGDGSRGLTLKRSRLADELAGLARHRGVDLRLGTVVTDVAAEPRPRVTTADGEVHEADLVVGADGVWSVVRRSLDPRAPAPRYLGLLNFGGVTRGTECAQQLPTRRWTMTFGRHAFFGAHPTDDGVWWFVNLPAEAPARGGAPDAQAWQQRLADLLAHDAGPGADLVRRGELELVAHGTYDLRGVPTWHRGGVGLIGDAAHAPSPTSGQGASMALEDAVVLARAAAATDAPEAAWSSYEGERRHRVERIVAEGARSASTKTPGPLGRAVRDLMLRAVFRWVATERNGAWMTGRRLSGEAETARERPADGTAR